MAVAKSTDTIQRFAAGVDLSVALSIDIPRYSSSELIVKGHRTTVDTRRGGGFRTETTVLVEGVDYTFANILPATTPARLTLIPASDAHRADWYSASNTLQLAWELTVEYDPDTFQTGNFTDFGRFTPLDFGKALDRLTMAIKSGFRYAQRSLSFSAEDTESDTTIADTTLPSLDAKIIKSF